MLLYIRFDCEESEDLTQTATILGTLIEKVGLRIPTSFVYLAKRYAVPLAPAPRVINKFSKDIAVYNLFSRIGIDEGTDQKTYLNRYNAAIKFLTLVAEGTVSIGTETEDPASAAAGGFKVKSNSRLFTREKMRGM